MLEALGLAGVLGVAAASSVVSDELVVCVEAEGVSSFISGFFAGVFACRIPECFKMHVCSFYFIYSQISPKKVIFLNKELPVRPVATGTTTA